VRSPTRPGHPARPAPSGYAVAGLRDKVIYVQSYSRSADGGYVPNGWLRVVAQDGDIAGLGQAILEALHNALHECSGSYEDHKRALSTLLTAASVRSYSKFVIGTRVIRVQADPQTASITFLPCRNSVSTGQNGGFQPMQELEFSIPGHSPRAHVGRAARTALSAAT
jgi:hypothetical protein